MIIFQAFENAFFFFSLLGKKIYNLQGNKISPRQEEQGKKRISRIFQKPQTIILSVLDEENAEFHNLLQQRTGASDLSKYRSDLSKYRDDGIWYRILKFTLLRNFLKMSLENCHRRFHREQKNIAFFQEDI